MSVHGILKNGNEKIALAPPSNRYSNRYYPQTGALTSGVRPTLSRTNSTASISSSSSTRPPSNRCSDRYTSTQKLVHGNSGAGKVRDALSSDDLVSQPKTNSKSVSNRYPMRTTAVRKTSRRDSRLSSGASSAAVSTANSEDDTSTADARNHSSQSQQQNVTGYFDLGELSGPPLLKRSSPDKDGHPKLLDEIGHYSAESISRPAPAENARAPPPLNTGRERQVKFALDPQSSEALPSPVIQSSVREWRCSPVQAVLTAEVCDSMLSTQNVEDGHIVSLIDSLETPEKFDGQITKILIQEKPTIQLSRTSSADSHYSLHSLKSDADDEGVVGTELQSRLRQAEDMKRMSYSPAPRSLFGIDIGSKLCNGFGDADEDRTSAVLHLAPEETHVTQGHSPIDAWISSQKSPTDLQETRVMATSISQTKRPSPNLKHIELPASIDAPIHAAELGTLATILPKSPKINPDGRRKLSKNGVSHQRAASAEKGAYLPALEAVATDQTDLKVDSNATARSKKPKNAEAFTEAAPKVLKKKRRYYPPDSSVNHPNARISLSGEDPQIKGERRNSFSRRMIRRLSGSSVKSSVSIELSEPFGSKSYESMTALEPPILVANSRNSFGSSRSTIDLPLSPTDMTANRTISKETAEPMSQGAFSKYMNQPRISPTTDVFPQSPTSSSMTSSRRSGSRPPLTHQTRALASLVSDSNSSLPEIDTVSSLNTSSTFPKTAVAAKYDHAPFSLRSPQLEAVAPKTVTGLSPLRRQMIVDNDPPPIVPALQSNAYPRREQVSKSHKSWIGRLGAYIKPKTAPAPRTDEIAGASFSGGTIYAGSVTSSSSRWSIGHTIGKYVRPRQSAETSQLSAAGLSRLRHDGLVSRENLQMPRGRMDEHIGGVQRSGSGSGSRRECR